MDPPGQNIVLPPFALMFPRKKEKKKPLEESFPASSENSLVNVLDLQVSQLNHNKSESPSHLIDKFAN